MSNINEILSNEEIKEYKEIKEKISSGIFFEQEEYNKFLVYSAKINSNYDSYCSNPIKESNN